MYTTELIDRQSVRTSFRFSEEANEALRWLSERYEVSMKEVLHSVLEHLIKHHLEKSEDDQHDNDELSKALGIGVILSESKKGMNLKKGDPKTIKKTVVITNKTLKNILTLSQKYKIPRNILLNNALIMSKKFTEKLDEANIDSYKEALELSEKLYLEAEFVEFNIREILSDDSVFNSIGLAVTHVMETCIFIEDKIKKIERLINK
jgi:hypothetical protein